MKKVILLIYISLFVSCSTQIVKEENKEPSISFKIDVTDHMDDLFHITVNTKNLSHKNNIYHFAATAPGTYQILDFGRFVQSIKAYDYNGNDIKVERISTNKWKLDHPEKMAKLEYDIEDSFDAEVNNHPVSPMCGSGIEKDVIALNTFAVLGYFDGLQKNPVELEIEYNSEWSIGTALTQKSNGVYYAENFDQLADSPILMGDLSFAETFVNDISVQVFVYSADTATSAPKILDLAEDILQSASGFIGYSPVPHYKFLMCLLDDATFAKNKLYGGGALEHSYSSLYVMSSSADQLFSLRSTMAHEFLHILTPLFLHSEVIHTYNFEEPTASQHIWLYEGVTEWASDIMQLRSGFIDIDKYLKIISGKLRMNEYFDQEISLKEMALTSYDESGYGNFLNFYERGAVTAALLDIRLLELSNGTKGLREVFLNLLNKYGKYKPFSEEHFFDEFVIESFPEIQNFIDNYILGSEELPHEEYFEKLGYKYIKERVDENGRPTLGTSLSINEDMEIITVGVQEEAKRWGLKEGDVILGTLGEVVNYETIRGIVMKTNDMKVGDPFTLKVRRDRDIIEINGNLLQRKERHIFIEIDELSEEQKSLRKAWSINLAFKNIIID